MGFTGTDKQYWTKRIQQTLDKKIKSITAGVPDFLKQVDETALAMGIRASGVGNILSDIETNKDRIEELQDQQTEVYEDTLLLVKELDAKTGRKMSRRRGSNDVSGNLDLLKREYMEEALSSSEIGREVLKIRNSKAGLMDAIMLATSSTSLVNAITKISEKLEIELPGADMV